MRKNYVHDRQIAESVHHEDDPRLQSESGESYVALENGNKTIDRAAKTAPNPNSTQRNGARFPKDS